MHINKKIYKCKYLYFYINIHRNTTILSGIVLKIFMKTVVSDKIVNTAESSCREARWT